jgi:hypothetical protein
MAATPKSAFIGVGLDSLSCDMRIIQPWLKTHRDQPTNLPGRSTHCLILLIEEHLLDLTKVVF